MARASNAAESFTPTAVKSAISKIESLGDEKESAHGAYMNRCAKIKARVDAAIDEGSRKGIPARALRHAIRIRKRRQKLQAQIEALEIEERDVVQHILTVNDDARDLPLFSAKVSKLQVREAAE
jgi:uncharacterized protein (UPF0335 family)